MKSNLRPKTVRPKSDATAHVGVFGISSPHETRSSEQSHGLLHGLRADLRSQRNTVNWSFSEAAPTCCYKILISLYKRGGMAETEGFEPSIRLYKRITV
jgi:hypothetical protein